MIDCMIEQLIEKRCDKPGFIMNHPMVMSPLAKSHAQGRTDDGGIPESIVPAHAAPFLSERFELFINKMEIINSYSEQNDEKLQREGFKLQTGIGHGSVDDELHRNDEDFLDALSYGMPPTAGWGCGIDRITMLMCGVKNIREIILFPMFRQSLFENKKKE